jgi:hypothetical protein
MIIEDEVEKKKIGIRNVDELIINFKERIVGMKFFEIDDNKIDVFVLSINGNLYNYRITSS